MIDMQEIDNTIRELENGELTFDSCRKLASLYIIKDFNTEKPVQETEVIKELNDILPRYRIYCDVKRQYELGNTIKENIIKETRLVCKEISEFLITLYANTNTQEERNELKNLIQTINKQWQ